MRRGFWGARVRGGLAPGNWSRNTNPIGIWRFYHRGVNTVGRPGGRCSGLALPVDLLRLDTHRGRSVHRPNDTLRSLYTHIDCGLGSKLFSKFTTAVT